MNSKNFTIVNKNTKEKKIASCIVKFNLNNKDYLVYSLEESEQNKQILTSKLIINSEEKAFIEEISNEEKNLLNDIVHNVVILVPLNFKKGDDANHLLTELKNKYNLTLSTEFPILEQQEYYSNSSIDIVNKTLVEEAVSFYSNNLPNIERKTEKIPVWDIPMTTKESHLENTMPLFNQKENTENSSNPQIEKLAVVSDSNLERSINLQPNVGKNYINNHKQAGFAKNKYIIIGTLCFVLSIIVIIAAIILIKNKQ